jgi:hypothetical protein
MGKKKACPPSEPPTLTDFQKEVLKAIQDYSAQLGDTVRKLAFAGLAVVWVFKTSDAGGQHIDRTPLPATLALVITMIVDFAQYAYSAAAWTLFNRYYDRRDLAPVNAPSWMNAPNEILFWGKAIALAVAYGLLLAYLVRHVLPA